MAITAGDLASGVESVESSGRQYAISPKGAIGLYQITPTLARQYGYSEGDLFSRDVQQDIYNRHMGYLLNKYKAPELALAAWNEGEGALQKGRFPAETRSYVPKVLSKVGGVISGALGEGTAYAEEPPATGGKRMPQKFQYSPTQGTYWSNGVQVPIDQVPADIRAKAAKKFGGSVAPAAAPSAPPPTPPAAASTPPTGGSAEDWYERQFNKLPGVAQYVLPGTIGEATGMLGSGLGLALAPETMGLSELIPMGAAMAGGYFEPSDQPWLSSERFKRAAIEGGKQLAGSAVGRGIGYVGGRIAPWVSKVPMIDRGTQRIGRGIAALFDHYPLAAPETMDALRRDIADGRAKEIIGDNLGRFREDLASKIPEYKPGAPVNPTLYGPGPAAPAGIKFTLPDVDAEGKLHPRDFSIRDGIEHVERMNALSYTVQGQSKGGELSWAYRKAGHQGRDALEKQLNDIARTQPNLHLPPEAGTAYRKLSADYGTAAELTDALQKGNVGRSLNYKGKRIEVLDQAQLKKVLDKDTMEHLSRLQGEGKKELFRRAVAPEGGTARKEEGNVAGSTLWHSAANLLTGHGAYAPEARAQLPAAVRALQSPAGRAVMRTPFVAAPRQFAGPLIHMDIRKTPEEMRRDAGLPP